MFIQYLPFIFCCLLVTLEWILFHLIKFIYLKLMLLALVETMGLQAALLQEVEQHSITSGAMVPLAQAFQL